MPEANLMGATIAGRESFLDAMAELEAETGYTDAGDLTVAELQIPGVLERLISTFNNDGRQVTSTLTRRSHWWWCEPNPVDTRTPTYIGRVTMLYDPPPRRGHIELAVRPLRRRQGHGLAILQAVMPIVAARGITTPTLVTRLDNVAARRLIERAGGVLAFEAPPDGLCKYLLDNVPSAV
jgi:GNAT superfamily N-acetyltransferase